jgi:kinase
VNQKVDVYSFGVVLLELTTGRRANHGDDEHQFLADWAWHHFQEEGRFMDAIDDKIRDSHFLDEIMLVFRLGLVCTSKLPPSRPTMKEVLRCLNRCEKKLVTSTAFRGEYEVARLLQDKESYTLNNFSGTIEEIDEAEDSIYFSMHIV